MKRIGLGGSLLLCLYFFVGTFITFSTHNLWCEIAKNLGLNEYHEFETLYFLSIAVQSSFFIFFITYLFKNKLIIRQKMRKAFATAIMNGLITLIAYLLLFAFVPSSIYPINIVHTFISCYIIAASTFYYFLPPIWELTNFKDIESLKEALKLEHESIRQVVYFQWWAAVFVTVSMMIIYISWTKDMLLPLIEKRGTLSTIVKLQNSFIIHIVYYFIGITIGIICQLEYYAHRSRKKIAEL